MSEIIFEPFRIKVVEPIQISTAEERRSWLVNAGYNMFNLRAEQVMIDLLTDSGTSAMSHDQWAALQTGDESYAGSKSFYQLEKIAREIFQKAIVIPVHQGRAAEHLLFHHLVKPGHIIPSNAHFDTTGANIEDNGGVALNLPIKEALITDQFHPFKGNIDTAELSKLLASKGEQVPFVMLTITNNSGGGQPVSMDNIEEVHRLCQVFKKKLIIDGCRFAENACFIKLRDKSYADWSVQDIAAKIFRMASVITFSGKKDALVNIGGLLLLDDPVFAEELKNRLIVTEGFATYGGLAGRDLAAMAQGLREVLDENYLRYRLRTIEWMVERLQNARVPVLIPAGGHALYINASRFFPHIAAEEFPGIAFTAELYRRGGIRAVELGNVAFGKRDDAGHNIFPPLDLVRLAFPRRVYTEAHAGYVVEKITELYSERDAVTGYRFSFEAPVMRHFRSRFEPIGN